jgi:hypothetical protein
MIGNLYTEAARISWCVVPGRVCLYENNDNGDPVKITFVANNNVIFAQYLTYDDNHNITKVECKAE